MRPVRSGTPSTALRSYTTNFPLTENPISEGGKWFANGTDRTRVRTTPGKAFGTMTSTSQPPYDDSYALLNGVWRPDIEIVVEIYLGPSAAGISEIECNFRGNDTPGSQTVTLYEVNLAWNGQYCNFGGWLGNASNLSNFFGLAPELVGPGVQFNVPGGVHDHDFFKCTLIGNALNAYIDYRDGNGYHLINTTGPVLDTAGAGGGARFTSGSPGIGFYDEAQNGAVDDQFGMRSATIREV
jgi:hypothetical protein